MALDFLINHLLESSAAEHPEQVAVMDGDRSVTYAELDSQANRLAQLLRRLGVSEGDRVGIYLEKSMEAVLAIYAVLKAGGVYVPLDPKAPPARLGYITGDCGVRVLLTGKEKAERWGDLIANGAPLDVAVVLNSDEDLAAPAGMRVVSRAALEDMTAEALVTRTIDQDLAYILYTSGSTGVPKGVMLTHRNALGFVHWAAEEVAVGPEDRLSSHAPFHFDLSIFDLFAAARGGASVVLVPPSRAMFPVEVARFIERFQITVWYSVPSILSMMTEHGGLKGDEFPQLRVMVFAGEVFPTKYLSRLMGLLPHVEFHNWYGPTETNVCTAYRVPESPEETSGDIPIGRAIGNDETIVLTEDGQRAGVGEAGELLVRGATVMRGYWGDPEKTSQRLVPNPLGGESGDVCYRTGDLVEQLPSGDYRFLGRRDHQIKSRGYRIELGEIETALYAHPDVVECAVVAIPDELISNRIKAYVVMEGEQREDELAKFCAERVPRYMIPEVFEFRELLPKTSTGKIDRQVLLTDAVSRAESLP